MSYQGWKDEAENFPVMDVRGATGNFFPAIHTRAHETPVGAGLHIVQSFEPIPLYDVMDQLGFERHTEQRSDTEWHVLFYRVKDNEDNGKIPMKPAALTNLPLIDNDLAEIAVNFWNLTWNDERRYLPHETRLLLSLANAVGAGRLRQATRELVKAYAGGTDSAAFDDLFELFAWNQGIGTFSSEIGPSTLFRAYKFIKQSERRGVPRAEICTGLFEQFGEKNPEVKVV